MESEAGEDADAGSGHAVARGVLHQVHGLVGEMQQAFDVHRSLRAARASYRPRGRQVAGAYPRDQKLRSTGLTPTSEGATSPLSCPAGLLAAGVAPAAGSGTPGYPRQPYREVIAIALARRRNTTAICQDLVDDHGLQVGYAPPFFPFFPYGPEPPCHSCRRGTVEP